MGCLRAGCPAATPRCAASIMASIRAKLVKINVSIWILVSAESIAATTASNALSGATAMNQPGRLCYAKRLVKLVQIPAGITHLASVNMITVELRPAFGRIGICSRQTCLLIRHAVQNLAGNGKRTAAIWLHCGSTPTGDRRVAIAVDNHIDRLVAGIDQGYAAAVVSQQRPTATERSHVLIGRKSKLPRECRIILVTHIVAPAAMVCTGRNVSAVPLPLRTFQPLKLTVSAPTLISCTASSLVSWRSSGRR